MRSVLGEVTSVEEHPQHRVTATDLFGDQVGGYLLRGEEKVGVSKGTSRRLLWPTVYIVYIVGC